MKEITIKDVKIEALYTTINTIELTNSIYLTNKDKYQFGLESEKYENITELLKMIKNDITGFEIDRKTEFDLYYMYNDDHRVSWERKKCKKIKTEKTLFIDNDIFKFINTFIDNQDKYKNKGIPYKTCILIHGPPGTGKTSTVKAIAADKNIPIYDFDLNKCNNDKQMFRLNEYMNENKYILLFDDIDKSLLFNGNEISMPILNFMLRIIDGVDDSDGRITILTCNDFEKIKNIKSLLRRINKIYKLDYCTREQVQDIIKFYLEKPIPNDMKIPKITPCELINIIYNNYFAYDKIMSEVENYVSDIV